MSVLAATIGGLAIDHIETVLSDHRDCRLIFPGLTESLAIGLHSELQRRISEAGIAVPVYLALDNRDSKLKPEKDKCWLYYEALTSVRQGSFIAVCMPKVLPKLQDSVRGSGSPLRALTFEDAWPWSESGAESFRFKGPVLERLLDRWSDSKADRNWLKEITLEGLLPATATLLDSTRVRLLIQGILDTFSPNSYSELEDKVDKFFFHCGIPRIVSRGSETVRQYVRDVTEIASRLAKLRKTNPEFRKHLVDDVAPTTFAGIDDLDEFRDALDLFLDGVFANGVDSGLLAFHGGLGPHSTTNGVNDWCRLDVERLRKLFGVRVGGALQISCKVSVPQGRGLVSADRNYATIFHGVSVNLNIDVKIGEERFRKEAFSIRCKRLRRVLAEHPCDAGQINIPIEIPAVELPSTKSRISLVIELLQFGEVLRQCRVYIHVCGEARSGLAIFEPGFEVVNLVRFDTGDDQLESVALPCRLPMTIKVLDWKATGTCDVSVNEERKKVNTVGKPMSGERGILYSLESPVDPEAFPGARTDVWIEASNRGREVTLTGDNVESGEFTLEDEFRVAAALSKSGRLRRVLPFFRGDGERVLPKLGNLDAASRRRMDLAYWFEGDSGWKPVILDFVTERYTGKGELCEGPYCRFAVSAPAFLRDPQPSADFQSAIAIYRECREMVLRVAKEYVDDYAAHSERSLYVVAPNFIENKSDEIERAIAKYLGAYLRALFLFETAELSAHEIFVLVNLDRVVLENSDGTESTLDMRISLMGPWHPLVVAKRYMVQYWLYRATSNKTSADLRLRRLVSLFERVDGFRVVPGFDADSLGPDISFAFPTSDPGWHVALNKDTFSRVAGTEFGSLLRLGERLRSSLGVWSPFYAAGSELWSDTFVRSFHRAHPSRRQLGLRLSGGFDARRVTDSCSGLLEERDRRRIPLGPLLPGGIHIFLEERLEDRNPIRWMDPMVFVYENQTEKDCFKHFQPDILLMPQGEETRPIWRSLGAKDNIPIPRGRGLGAVFFFPLVHLSPDRHGLPVSRVFESGVRRGSSAESSRGSRATNLSIDDYYLQVLDTCDKLARRVRQQRPALVKELGLPESLRCQWTVLSGTDVDAGGLATYIADSGVEADEDRVLWDYRVDVGQSVKSYFVVCRVPKSVIASLSTNMLELGAIGVSSVLRELSEVGFAVGDTMRSGKAAVGVLGVVGALRLVKTAWAPGNANGRRWCTALLPVDCFTELLAPALASGGASRRTDLLAVHLIWNLHGEPDVILSPCAVECKYVSGVFPESAVASGLSQAEATYDVVHELVRCSLTEGGMHGRLALGRMIRFGLRLLAARDEVAMEDEQLVLEAILSGSFAFLPPLTSAMLITTSCGATGPTHIETHRRGWWVRLTAESWPRERPSPDDEPVNQITTVFRQIRSHSGIQEIDQRIPPPVVSGSEASDGESSGPQREGPAHPNPTAVRRPIPASKHNGPSIMPTKERARVNESKRPVVETPATARIVHSAFNGFVGNQPAVEALTIQLRYAEAIGTRSLRPVGLFGPKSTGKTELARRIAAALRVPRLFLSETSLGSVDQLADRMQRQATEAGHVMQAQGREGGLAVLQCPPMLVFIDEVHQLSLRVQDSLLPVLESDDRMLRGSQVILNAQHVSFIVATTDWGKLREPFRSRVRPIRLEPYNTDEVARMLRFRIEGASKGVEGAAAIDPAVARLGEEALRAIATAARAVPRTAIDLLREIGMALRIELCDGSTSQVWHHLQRLVPCDRYGLTPQDHKYLQILASRGPVGLENIAVDLGIDRSNVSGAIEPFLIQTGWVQLTPAGRILTPDGIQFVQRL